MKNEIERDPIVNSYYIIYYFNQNGEKITNVKLQKLLYFLEAIYLIQNKEETKLFKEEFYARRFGPFLKSVQKKFWNYQGADITSTDEIQKIALNMNSENKKYDGNVDEFTIVQKTETRDWFADLLKI